MCDLIEEFIILQDRNSFIHRSNLLKIEKFRLKESSKLASIPKFSRQECADVYDLIMLITNSEIIFSSSANISDKFYCLDGKKMKMHNIRSQRKAKVKKKVKDITAIEYMSRYGIFTLIRIRDCLPSIARPFKNVKDDQLHNIRGYSYKVTRNLVLDKTDGWEDYQKSGEAARDGTIIYWNN